MKKATRANLAQQIGKQALALRPTQDQLAPLYNLITNRRPFKYSWCSLFCKYQLLKKMLCCCCKVKSLKKAQRMSKLLVKGHKKLSENLDVARLVELMQRKELVE